MDKIGDGFYPFEILRFEINIRYFKICYLQSKGSRMKLFFIWNALIYCFAQLNFFTLRKPNICYRIIYYFYYLWTLLRTFLEFLAFNVFLLLVNKHSRKRLKEIKSPASFARRNELMNSLFFIYLESRSDWLL